MGWGGRLVKWYYRIVFDHVSYLRTCFTSLFLHTVMDFPQPPHDHNLRLFRNDVLGSGSYGVVCKATWGQRRCAAKLLHPIFFQSNDPGIMTRRIKFEQECHFLNDMRHPHIVEYLGTSHDPASGLLMLLMELMDESLTHFLERSQQPLAFHTEVNLCHDIAKALVYIHSKEIIHRDLSSNNILLLAGRAKITDFGMSKLLDSNRRMTPLTMCPGTLAYMPPEALREPPVYSKKIDCFSFGVLQIQIMTRQFPDPGPLKRVVEDTRSPTGTIEMPVLDSERRKSHIDLIDPTHTLLSTALNCLSYLEKDRPSAQDLCRQLVAIKEAPRYTQLQFLQQEFETKDQQLQDSQRCMNTLQLELQDSQRQIQQLTHQVEEKQHTIDDKDTVLRELNQQLQSNVLIMAEFQQNLLQHEQTVGQLSRDLQQTVEEKRACERRLRELNEQLIEISRVGARPHEITTPARQELQQSREKQHATGDPRLLATQQLGTLSQKTVVQQKAIRDMKWQKPSKAPEKMCRGSAAADSNVAYFNGYGSTRVHSFDSNTQKWRQLPAALHTKSTLVVVHHILTMVGGEISGAATDSLLSLMGEGRDQKWLPNLPAMPTKRYCTAAVCSGCSLIVTGGEDGRNRLATVEVLDTDTLQWSIASSLTHPISGATISICGERLYMMGGSDEKTGPMTRSVCGCSITELLQSCQPPTIWQRVAQKLKSTIWQCVADAPHYFSSCATLCGQLVAVGGRDRANKDTSAITRYNETTDSWEIIGHMPTARWLALVVILNGKMMVVGGWVGGSLKHFVVGGLVTDVVELLC